MSYSGSEGGSFISVTINKVGNTTFDTTVTVQSFDGSAAGMGVWQYECMTVWMHGSMSV